MTLERFFAAHPVESVRVEWCDLHGLSRGKWMTPAHFERALEHGTTFSSAALRMDLQGDAHLPPSGNGEPAWVSVVARPDLDTLHAFHGEPGSVRCLADLYTLEGEPLSHAPRAALRRVIATASAMGYQPMVGLEQEFYLLSGTDSGRLPAGRQVYRMQTTQEEQAFLDPLRRQMAEGGIAIEAFCAEDGPGQFEVVLDRAPALSVADAAFTLRCLVKEQAARMGLIATFLSRPLVHHSGSGAHLHQSLWSPASEPVFRRDEGLFWSYLAGQLRHFREAAAFYLPTVNAYKRLLRRQPPLSTVNWAQEDRGVAVRVVGNGGSLRIENRMVAGEANPYLSIAAAFATGLEGVQQNAVLPGGARQPDGSDGDGSTIGVPRTLAEALDDLDGSPVMRRWLGDDLVDTFVLIKRSELARYETAITDWELQEYLHSL